MTGHGTFDGTGYARDAANDFLIGNISQTVHKPIKAQI
jgi:hypothetical protein